MPIGAARSFKGYGSRLLAKTEGGKPHWLEVGAVWPHKNGTGFDLVIPKGLAVSGRIICVEPKAKAPRAIGRKPAKVRSDSRHARSLACPAVVGAAFTSSMTPFGTGLGEPSLPMCVIEQRFRRGRRKRWAVAGVMRPEGRTGAGRAGFVTPRGWGRVHRPAGARLRASRRETPREAAALSAPRSLRTSRLSLVVLPHDAGWTPALSAGSLAPLRGSDGRGFAPTRHRRWGA